MKLKQFYKLMGIKGAYLYICKRLKTDPIPVKVPIFGTVSTCHEIKNIQDNFIDGRLRDKEIEEYLSKKEAPCVIDCGSNVGVTVRWWFHLNKNARVYGIDMLKETQDFTVRAVKSIGVGEGEYTPIVATLWSEDEKSFKVIVGDPLRGDWRIQRDDKDGDERDVTTSTLNSVFRSRDIKEVDLLKVDIEGAGGEALLGASDILKKTKYVVVEIHTYEECKKAGQALAANGFNLRMSIDKNLWFEKAS
jgi:FkbM family methyltransferase